MPGAKVGSEALAKLPGPLAWGIHNAIAHPLGWWLELGGWLLGPRAQEIAERVSNEIHDRTVPRHKRGEGRG